MSHGARPPPSGSTANPTPVTPDPEALVTLHDRLFDIARSQPESDAIVTADRKVSFGTLADSVGQLANALADAGLEEGQRVGLIFETGPRLVEAMFATLASGGVMVCLDPAYPSARLGAILQESTPAFVIGDQQSLAEHSSLLEGRDLQRFVLGPNNEHDTLASWDVLDQVTLAPYPTTPPSVPVEPSSPCYIAYTSGSTGRPKGILQSHAAFSQFIAWQSRQLNIGPGDRWAQWASIAYDASYCEIFGALCFGAVLILTDATTRYNPAALVGWASGQDATILQVVPSFAREVVEVLERGNEWPSLRLVMLAGERLPVDLARRWMRVSADPPAVYNLYGPSETVLATFHELSPADLERRSIPIGNAIDGREILLLDSDARPVAPGASGEIYIRSPYLAVGYYGNDDETERKFIQNPLHNAYRDTVYQTGDLGRLLPEGSLEFIGREDGLVKLRGVRIELGEIETAVRTFAGVHEAAAVVQTVDVPRPKLIAKEREARGVERDVRQILAVFYTATHHIDTAALRDQLQLRLPVHMLPQYLVQLDALPRNANHKIDTGALPQINISMADRPTELVAPRTEAEKKIAAVWKDILSVGEVGATDGFFEIGGDSILAMRVLSQLRTETGVDLTFRDLFEHQTVEQLAKALESGEQSRRQDPAPPQHIAPADGTAERGFYPLSLAQLGIWFLWRLEPDSPYYTAQGSIRLEGPLDLDSLRRAWSLLIQRHEILRSSYALRDGNPVQIFRTEMPTELPLVDLSTMDHGDREDEMDRLCRLRVRPLDLEKDPLFEGVLFHFDAEEHELAITFHEIVLDLWGLSLVMKDLHDLYRMIRRGNSVDEVEPPVLFQAYVDWEQSHLTHERLKSQRAYWARQLEGELPILALPTDYTRPATPTYRGAAENVFLSVELSQALKQLSRERRTTLFMTLLTAFYVLLNAYSRQSDVIVGAPIANRSHARSDEIVGFFLNMLPLRAAVDPKLTFAELLDEVREVVSEGIFNANYPFPWILESVDIPRDRSVSPVFQVMFNMLNLPQQAIEDDDLTITFNEIDSGFVKYDLSLYAQEHGDRIFLQLAYMQDLFEPATVERMLCNLEVFLTDVVAQPDRVLSDLRLVSEAERKYLIDGFNQTDTDFEISETIEKMFEKVVAERPDDVAYRFRQETITYAELNTAANRLARRLQEAGVEKGSRVAICVDRGFDVATTTLAVLKAGGAYVALDPEYPLPRLRQILEDASCGVVIVSPDLDRFDAFNGSKVDPRGEDLSAFDDSDLGQDRIQNQVFSVVYTSSTTGRPKGVAISQTAVINRLAWMWTHYPFRSGDVAVMQKSNALVAASWELFGGLLVGVPTVLLEVDDLRDPSRLWDVCVSNNVSHFLGVPALLEGILLEAETRDEGWSSLRLATTSAEPIPPEMVARWQRAFPAVPLLNLYGATECSSNALSYDTTNLHPASSRVPVGVPLDNVQAYILDEAFQPVPWGATGELCIGGRCVAQGYVGPPSAAAERFGTSPYRSGEALYRTGDHARLRHDGNIELLGRSDLQVKVRGFRVELNDVESVLQGHPLVIRCAAVLDDRDPERPRLVALVEAPGASESDLREFLVERLPGYMIPAQFAIVDVLPLTPNGKVNRAGLLLPEAVGGDDRGLVAPRDPIEQELVSIWEDLLAVSPVGVTDNFFDIGGYSLLAVRMMDRIGKALGHSLPIALLFQTPTVEALANHLRTATESGSGRVSWETVVPIQTGGDRPPFFCVHDGAGGVFHFNYLARNLGEDQPFYGLQPQAWDYGRDDAPTISGLAEHYVSAIRSVQSEGPYMIGGFCFGGIVAFEVAQQLQADGDEVGVVALLEPSRVRNRFAPTPPNGESRLELAPPKNALARFAARVKSKLVHKQGAEIIDPAKVGTYRSPGEILALAGVVATIVVKRAICRGYRATGRPIPRRLRNFYFKDQVSRKAGVRYEATPYEGRIDIFLARRHGLDWYGLATDGISIHQLPADESGYVPDHLTMLRDPWIKYVADPLRAAIDDAIERDAREHH